MSVRFADSASGGFVDDETAISISNLSIGTGAGIVGYVLAWWHFSTLPCHMNPQ